MKRKVVLEMRKLFNLLKSLRRDKSISPNRVSFKTTQPTWKELAAIIASMDEEQQDCSVCAIQNETGTLLEAIEMDAQSDLPRLIFKAIFVPH